MLSEAILVSALALLAEARFGQEQVPVAAVQAVTSGGQPGQAATLAGAVPGVLLAAANPCAKLQLADKIIAQLGNGDDAITAAKGVVAAEQNFNPFTVSVPSICSDPTLPTTAALRGIIPLVDPAVVGSDVENANSNSSLQTPFNADGLSVAQIMIANGFSNFTSKALDGTTDNAPAAISAATAVAAVSSAAPAATTFSTVTVPATTTTAAAAAAATSASSYSSMQKSTISGLDFGLCVPTMKFEAGLNGRPDTEFTFQAIDPLVNKGQQEALNPNIITNRICDQLTNVCQANDAAKFACQQAKTQIQALNAKDVTVAEKWNAALGFAGADTNPDNAPQV
ncbi:hypothetical protein SS1G_13115 [Paecilomyces variotii No. 5]|uniref:Circumsporozoite protein n=1 Tax=Byssochlamys spectabilis (strain No. 5 / NBRC 109023) TaxID=1356009 RepID=V5FSX7_BYSSN|nr:hypothetical protein SS1G_13115 [Paecilomyces variotii No. 5]